MKIFDNLVKKMYKQDDASEALKYTDYYGDLARTISDEFDAHRIGLRLFDSKLSNKSIKYLEQLAGLSDENIKQKELELADVTVGIFLNSSDLTDAKNEFLELTAIIIAIFKKNKLFVKSLCIYSTTKKSTTLNFKYQIILDGLNKKDYSLDDIQKNVTLLDL